MSYFTSNIQSAALTYTNTDKKKNQVRDIKKSHHAVLIFFYEDNSKDWEL